MTDQTDESPARRRGEGFDRPGYPSTNAHSESIASERQIRRPCPDCGGPGPDADPEVIARAHLVLHDCDTGEWTLLRLNIPWRRR